MTSCMRPFVFILFSCFFVCFIVVVDFRSFVPLCWDLYVSSYFEFSLFFVRLFCNALWFPWYRIS